MFTERLSGFMAAADFGQTVTVNGVTITAIFDNDYARVGQFVASGNPVLYCKESDVAAVIRGQAAVVDGTNYRVRDIEPDGTGVTVLQLEIA